VTQTFRRQSEKRATSSARGSRKIPLHSARIPSRRRIGALWLVRCACSLCRTALARTSRTSRAHCAPGLISRPILGPILGPILRPIARPVPRSLSCGGLSCGGLSGGGLSGGGLCHRAVGRRAAGNADVGRRAQARGTLRSHHLALTIPSPRWITICMALCAGLAAFSRQSTGKTAPSEASACLH